MSWSLSVINHRYRFLLRSWDWPLKFLVTAILLPCLLSLIVLSRILLTLALLPSDYLDFPLFLVSDHSYSHHSFTLHFSSVLFYFSLVLLLFLHYLVMFMTICSLNRLPWVRYYPQGYLVFPTYLSHSCLNFSFTRFSLHHLFGFHPQKSLRISHLSTVYYFHLDPSISLLNSFFLVRSCHLPNHVIH